MKFLRLIKECPILIGIVTVALLLTLLGVVFRSSAYSEYIPDDGPWKVPALSYVFQGARDGAFPFGGAAGSGEDVMPQAEVSEEETLGSPEDGMGDTGVAEGEADPAKETTGGEENASDDGLLEPVDVSGNSADVSGNDVEEEVYEFTEVDDDYFTDALFIGDSRTVGLSEYCEALDTRATFYSKVSLTIYTCMDKDFVKTEDGKITVDQALRENQFGKIYIMLGLNEIGTGDTEYFKNAYQNVLDRIIELQPDAIIYIQGIMHVAAGKSDHDKYFNNDIINARNAALAELADQKRIFYIDMNEAVDDENGNLDSSLSFDDVHLKASAYERWHEFLLHNAIVR